MTLSIGRLIDEIPMLLVYINLSSISVTILTFALIYSSKYFIDTKRNINYDKKKEITNDSMIWRKNSMTVF
jgi:hypothetical protein